MDGNSSAAKGANALLFPLFFKVNRQPVFAKGFNWMPVDVLPLPQDAEQTQRTQQVRSWLLSMTLQKPRG